MKEENLKVLDKIESIEALKLIKSEAEMVLDELFSSENIITNKANTIFQILIVLVFSLFGYLVTLFKDDVTNIYLIEVCFVLIFTSSISIYFLLKIIYPRINYSKGTIPSKILFDDIVIKDWEELGILKNRIYNLEVAINNNKAFQLERITNFKKSINILLIGMLLVIVNSLITFINI